MKPSKVNSPKLGRHGLNRLRHPLTAAALAAAGALLLAGPARADTLGTLVSELSGKCVDVFNASSADGTDVIQWTCNGGDNQIIRLVPTASTAGAFTVRFRHSNKCLEVAGNSTAAGANLQQASCDGGNNQAFDLEDSGQGNYQLRSRLSGHLVSLASASTGDGVSLQQLPSNGGAEQRWILETHDDRPAAVYGRWGDVIPWPHIAVSAANLPDGRILTFSGSERETWPTTEFTYSATLDPTTRQFNEISHQTHNMFCAHLAMLEDGQVFANGGRNQTNSPWTSLFDYQNDRWVQIENMETGGRWYPTTLALADGDVFTAIGTATNQRNPERWDRNDGWRILTGIDFDGPVLSYGGSHGEHRWWPLLHLAPQGKIFHSGPTPTVGWINTERSGAYEDTGIRLNSFYHKHGTSIMYDEGKILQAGGWISGGNTSSSDQAFTIDLNGPAPVIQPTDPMNQRRKFHNGVMLPDGRVLVIGGNTSGQKFNDNGTQYSTEIWNPTTGTWFEAAEMAVPRNYHSVALLVPDGRVLSAGGGYCSGSRYCSGASHRDGQFYSPDYLFASDGSLAPRPTILNGPGRVENNGVFDVNTTGTIDYFSLIKMGSTTHGMNTDVRYLRPSFTGLGGGAYRVTVPGNPNVLTPGYWMLFAVDTDGVPSVAHIVQVTNKAVQFDNVALLGTTRQSSTASGGDLGSGNAIDGDMTGTDESGSVTQTNAESRPFWEIDLLSTYDLDSIRLWNRTDCCTGQLSDLYILASDVPFVSDDLDAARQQEGVTSIYLGPAVDSLLDIDLGRTARFVRVQKAGTGSLSLAEVQLFGEAPGAGAPGIVHYDYYNGNFSTLPDFSSLTPVRSGTVGGFNLSPQSDTDDFAIRYYGKLIVPAGATYTFYTTSDDGSRLWIDGQLVVDNDGIHGVETASGSITLTGGSHDIMVGYFDATGGEVLTVEWESPTMARGEIPSSALTLLPQPAGRNEVLREWWTGISSTAVSALTSSPNYPDNPSGSDVRSLFEAPINWNDNYGTRMRGYLYPPFSGFYTFWISSDDNGELWLSTDDDPANIQRIANVPSWSSSRQWDKFPEQQSAPVFLRSDQRYYIEALQQEAGGGDNLAVAWATPFSPREVIDGAYLSTPFTQLSILAIGAPPQVVTQPVTMTAAVEGDDVTYSWSYGDGTPDTPFTDSPVTSHDYGQPGRYTVSLTVRDGNGAQQSVTFTQLVHLPLTSGRPNASSSLVFHGGRAEVWNVNPDNDSVSAIDANMNAKVAEIAVPANPRALTVAVDGRVWVTSKDASKISVVDPASGSVAATIDLPRGSAPHGIVADLQGPDVYVALESTGEIRRYDALGLNLVDSTNLGRGVRHLSLTADGGTLLVSRFITPAVPGEDSGTPNVAAGGGEVLRLDTTDLSTAGITLLQHSNRLASEHSGPGLPNYLRAAVVSPDGVNAWVASKQDNILRGFNRDGSALTHDHTVRAVSSRVALPSGAEDFSSRIDHDNASVASASAYGLYGVYLFTALEGNRQVAISDAHGGTELMRFDVGRAPEGIALSPSGDTLYVHNFMDRTVSAIDVSALSATGELIATPVATIGVVAAEALAAEVLNGKQLFYDARDERLAAESYMSCASCHNAGGQDGRTWDFTDLGEGLRNTVTLKGRGLAAAHGLLHWTGNFDEVQDFENQIRGFAGGTGLMSDPDFAATSDLLGTPKAGRSADLDALAGYVASLIEVPRSPDRNASGAFTPDAEAGRLLFDSIGCQNCHVGTGLTDSFTGVRHDVGTLDADSGQRLGGPLDGFDTPSLLGLWETAPYLHDGSASDLAGAVLAHVPQPALSAAELDQLVAYLRQIEEGSTPVGCADVDDDCDGVDDDCDGTPDDDFVSSATTCGLGECAGNSGFLTCPPVEVWGANTSGQLFHYSLTDRTDTFAGTLPFGTQAIERDMNTGRIYIFENGGAGDEFGYWDPVAGVYQIVRNYGVNTGFLVKRMAQMPDGRMILSDNFDTVYEIDLDNGDLTNLGTFQGLEVGAFGPTGDMVFAPDGTLYVVNYDDIYAVNFGTLTGAPVAENLLATTDLRIFTGAAFCGGELYATDARQASGRSAVYRIDLEAGTAEELWVTTGFVNDLASCAADGRPLAAVDSCDPLEGSGAEICDGLDNDCDGSVDEGDVCGVPECAVDADCDDGSFCNGAETCNAGVCTAGSAPCGGGTCDEATDTCPECSVDADCDDGAFCNGVETCVAGSCTAGTDPCAGGTCDEAADTCPVPECTVDADCDDGIHCNGAETCAAGTCTAGADPCPGASCDEGTETCSGVLPAARLETGTVVVGAAPVTVSLAQTYVDPIIVTTPQLATNSAPIVTRVGNVTGDSFDLRLQQPAGATPSAETVHYLVVEAGSWTIDGVRIEARSYDAANTSDARSWAADAQTYAQAYTDPIVLAQVMSENDPNWSVAWMQGANRVDPPSAASLGLGKTTAEEFGAVRATERIGWVVIEAGAGTLGGVPFVAAESPDAVAGVTNAPPYTIAYPTPFSTAPEVTVATMAGVDGGNGGWAVLYGASPLAAGSLDLAIDEDDVNDPERNHTSEQVHYVSFGAAFSYEAAPECAVDGDCDDGLFCNGAETCTGGSCTPGAAPCSGACDEEADACIVQTTRMETVVTTADGTSSRVTLSQAYDEAVVSCTVQYAANTTPVVPRVSGVSGNGFDLRLQNPSGGAVAADAVHCLVVEAGLHQVDGLTIEARRIPASITDHDGSWGGIPLAFTHPFVNPTILGQVMTENDAAWSVFWNRGSSRTAPPSASAAFVGKTVCEDPSITRAEETLGVIVIEGARSTVAGVAFEAGVGPDTVRGVSDGAPAAYTYSAPFSSTPQVVLLTMAGMDGVNGGWAQLMGADAISATQFFLAIDEDQVNDTERAHTTEQVGLVVFESAVTLP